jgi:DnaK suppressor protein
MNQKTGHSEEFIHEMEQRLLEEKEQLAKELEAVARNNQGNYQAKFPEYGRHDEENVTEIADYEAMVGTTEAIEERLKNVTEALERIENGTYGYTEDGEMIPEERLRANPAAVTLATPPRAS